MTDALDDAWRQYCRMLEMAGSVITREGSPTDPLDRAEGYRYLTRLVRAGLEAFVEHADPAAPELRRMVHETVKMGADNPDNHYFNAPLHGRHRYRLEGTRGTVRLLTLSVQEGTLGQGGGMPPVGKIAQDELPVDDDGRFVVLVGGERPDEGAWLPLPEGDALLIVRQTFGDRETETPAEVTVRRVDGPHALAPLSPEAVAEGLGKAGRMVGGAAAMFANWAEGFTDHVNALPRFDPETSTAAGGDPAIAYYHSYWALEADQVLRIRFVPPPCAYWNFQLNNHWMESLDYRHHRVVINDAGAAVDDDGSVTILVAHEALDHPNALVTAGHRRGTMCLRWVQADHHPDPEVEVVTRAEVG